MWFDTWHDLLRVIVGTGGYGVTFWTYLMVIAGLLLLFLLAGLRHT